MSQKYSIGIKNLEMLWNYWKIPDFTPDNTLIIDDLKEVYEKQPHNCINIKPFNIKDRFRDTELIKIIH